MVIRFQCSACSRPIEVDEEWGNRPVVCPFCEKTVTAPSASTWNDPHDPDAAVVPPAADQPSAGAEPDAPRHSSADPVQTSDSAYPAGTTHAGVSWSRQPGHPAVPAAVRRRPSNLLAYAALIASGCALLCFVFVAVTVADHQEELKQLEEAYVDGGLAGQQRVILDLMESNNGQPPGWFVAFSVLSLTYLAATVIGAVLAIIALARGCARLPAVIALFVSCGFLLTHCAGLLY